LLPLSTDKGATERPTLQGCSRSSRGFEECIAGDCTTCNGCQNYFSKLYEHWKDGILKTSIKGLLHADGFEIWLLSENI